MKQVFFGGKRRYYDEYWALRDICFSIRQGEAVGIVGRNGSGKSTLLQVICGITEPTRRHASSSTGASRRCWRWVPPSTTS